ncbi:MAG TPA: DedA family protein [Chloroflexota bacterium]|nr:DedA family protein [Chloroflexota bacterium]
MVGNGYPVLAIILFTGAFGLPLPSGLATGIAGSMVARGELSWAAAILVATIASVLGDVAGYGVGRAVGVRMTEGVGRWIGLSATRMSRAEGLFSRWGMLSLLLSRTIFSGLSSPINLVAGVTHYGLGRFLVYDLGGRLIWAFGYLTLGFAFERYTGLLIDLIDGLWGLAGSIVVAAVAGYLLYRSRQPRATQ